MAYPTNHIFPKLSLFSSQNYSVVTIRRSGLYNGIVQFKTQSASIDEDGSATTTLQIIRTQAYYDVTVRHSHSKTFTSLHEKNYRNPNCKRGVGRESVNII